IDEEIKAEFGRPRIENAVEKKEEPKRSSGLLFGRRIATADDSGANARFGVQTGARIRARLDINLDSRTVGGGPAVAKLVRSYIADAHIVIPAGTMLYGDARVSGSRFGVKFTRMVLPTKREVAFEGIAYDLADRKPGLAAGRRIAATAQREGAGEKV